MPIKRKTGEYFTWREFFSQWREGMKHITPLQQVKSNQLGFLVVFAGILWGMSLSVKTRTWWLLVILSGSFIITGNSFHANWRKKKVLEKIEEEMEDE